MFRSKRDVDRHVAELEEKVPSEVERALKGMTIARLYFNVGEHDLALKHLEKFCEVKPTSAQAFKFRGQVFEAKGFKGPSEQKYVNQTAAVEAYKRSYELDLSQREILLKICDLMSQLPVRDPSRAR